MAKYLITTLVLAASALADDSSAYAAPQGGYAAPAAAYAPAAPTGYGAPDSGYGAPAAEYAAESYEEPSSYYGEPAEADAGGFDLDLSKILELLPLFLAVFAAIIVAQLFAPLLGVLFNAKVGLLGGVLGPLGGIKGGLINIVLNPFGLQLCTTATPPVAFTGRSSASGFSLNKDMVDTAANLLYEAVSSKLNTYNSIISLSFKCCLYFLFLKLTLVFLQSTNRTRQANEIYKLKSDTETLPGYLPVVTKYRHSLVPKSDTPRYLL